MKLIPIIPKSSKVDRPYISLAKGAGKVTFNKCLTEKLKVPINGTCTILHDEERPDDFYLCFGREDGAKIIEKKYDKYSQVAFSNNNAVQRIHKLLEAEKNTIRLLVATEPIDDNGETYYAILTKSYAQLNN